MSVGLSAGPEPRLSELDEPSVILRREPRPAPPLSGRIPALDAVRGLAILMVTGFRFFPKYEDPSLAGRVLSPLLGQGLRGVDLFFVLSGFLITGILWDAKGQSHYFRNFYLRRTLRIFPLYYGVLFVTLVLLPAVGFGMYSVFAQGHQYSPWLWLYGTNILIAWKGHWCLGAFDHFWSLAVEEQFYLVWPLVIFLCSRTTAIKVCFGAIFLSVAARIAWLLSGGDTVAIEAFTLFRLDSLAIGSLLALAARSPDGIAKWRPAAICCGVMMLVGFVPLIFFRAVVPMVRDTMFACLFGSVIVLAVTAPTVGWWGRLWHSPILRFFGKYSYGMYVFQNILKAIFLPDVFIASFAAGLGSIFLGRCGYLMAMSLATLLAALISWHVLEKHFLRLKSQVR
jgi:peptidoglycan/LPS O-acetylase OafA/YrhL